MAKKKLGCPRDLERPNGALSKEDRLRIYNKVAPYVAEGYPVRKLSHITRVNESVTNRILREFRPKQKRGAKPAAPWRNVPGSTDFARQCNHWLIQRGRRDLLSDH